LKINICSVTGASRHAAFSDLEQRWPEVVVRLDTRYEAKEEEGHWVALAAPHGGEAVEGVAEVQRFRGTQAQYARTTVHNFLSVLNALHLAMRLTKSWDLQEFRRESGGRVG
jgi:hypothetical protein